MTQEEQIIIGLIVLTGLGIVFMRAVAAWLDANKIERIPRTLTPIEYSLLNQFLDCGYTEIESGSKSDLVWLIGPGKEEAIFSKTFKLFDWLQDREDIQEIVDSYEVTNEERA